MTQAALCNQKYGKYGTATLIQTGIFHKRWNRFCKVLISTAEVLGSISFSIFFWQTQFAFLTSISSMCDADPVLLGGALAGIAAWVPTVKRLKSTQRYEYGLVCGCGLLSSTGICTTSGWGSVGLCMSEDCSVGRSLLDHPQLRRPTRVPGF